MLSGVEIIRRSLLPRMKSLLVRSKSLEPICLTLKGRISCVSWIATSSFLKSVCSRPRQPPYARDGIPDELVDWRIICHLQAASCKLLHHPGDLRSFALIFSALPYCARNSRNDVLPRHALSTPAVEQM